MKIAVQNPYTSDNIGNRERSETLSGGGGVTNTYQANLLNQYTNISNGTVEEPTYDDDGNMLTHDGWTFTWNGENRMVSATNESHQISWAYDYAGRCFEKVKDGNAVDYVWDGYNIISEVNNSTTNFNVWGEDSGGGVGGLLAVIQDDETYFTCYDANGNICQYLDNTGDIVANREYSPFGETFSLTGSKQDDFTHWWSTKPWDADTGMSEYEFRMYLVALGRWASRDLIGEWSEFNLYGFLKNNCLTMWDYWGLYITQDPRLRGPGLRDTITGRIASRESLRQQLENMSSSQGDELFNAEALTRLQMAQEIVGNIRDAIVGWISSNIIESFQNMQHGREIMNWCAQNAPSRAQMTGGRYIRGSVDTVHVTTGDTSLLGSIISGSPLTASYNGGVELIFVIDCACGNSNVRYSGIPYSDVNISGDISGEGYDFDIGITERVYDVEDATEWERRSADDNMGAAIISACCP